MLADSQIIYDTFVTIKTYDFPTYFYIYSHRNERTFAEVEPNHLDAGEFNYSYTNKIDVSCSTQPRITKLKEIGGFFENR